MTQAVFRFAPSPNGRLHIGHAYSALLNQKMAIEIGGKILLRIEDTDLQRCTPLLEEKMIEDLDWLGFYWDEPPFRQSDQFDRYSKFVDILYDEGLVYPAFMSRGEVREYIKHFEASGQAWPRDPDGAAHYPPLDKQLSLKQREDRIKAGEPYALRLDMDKAIDFVGKPLSWEDEGQGPNGEEGEIQASPNLWGDVILTRKDTPASYHLACVLDDAFQGVTHVVRGRDLFWATSVHRLLQELAGLQVPRYFHHDLILTDDGQKLSKSNRDTSIAELRNRGASADDIKKMIGLA